MAHTSKRHRLDSLIVGLTAIDIPVVSGAVVLVSAIALPIIIVTKRRQIKRELNAMWQLADELGYTAADLKQLSGQKDYGTIDWALTRPGQGQTVVPSLAAIQLVHTRLAMLDQV
ncbi:hypothetical protein [Lacticaseibacillus jixiensis]|uniref:hypothetical protein n=1 Tax=Lacticaseibacillus jixiensis TaxID=3231926 RepID=UPI0036F1F685